MKAGFWQRPVNIPLHFTRIFSMPTVIKRSCTEYVIKKIENDFYDRVINFRFRRFLIFVKEKVSLVDCLKTKKRLNQSILAIELPLSTLDDGSVIYFAPMV